MVTSRATNLQLKLPGNQAEFHGMISRSLKNTLVKVKLRSNSKRVGKCVFKTHTNTYITMSDGQKFCESIKRAPPKIVVIDQQIAHHLT